MHVLQAGDAYILLGGAKTEQLGGGRFAFKNQIRARIHPRGPFRRPRGSGSQNEDARGDRRLGHESDGLQEEGPAALVVGEHRKGWERCGSQQGREQERQGRERSP